MAWVGPALTAAGGVLGTLGSEKTKPVLWAPWLEKYDQQAGADWSADRTRIDKGLNAYDTRQQERAALGKDLQGKQIQDTNSLVRQILSQDRFGQERTLRKDLLGDLWSGADRLVNKGKGLVDMAKAKLGYFGGRGGSFTDSLMSGLVNTSLGPTFGNILTGTAGNVGRLASTQAQDWLNALGAIGARTEGLNIGNGLELTVPEQALALHGGSTANLGQITDVTRANIAGLMKKKNAYDRASQALQAVGGAASIGGMLGGMGGGGGGGGGGGAWGRAGGIMGSLGSLVGSIGGGGGGQDINSMPPMMPQNTSGLDNWGDLSYLDRMRYAQALRSAQGYGTTGSLGGRNMADPSAVNWYNSPPNPWE